MSDRVEPYDGIDELAVRPYVITSGRTVGASGDIPIETLVVAHRGVDGLKPDQAAVVAMCGQPMSVAEIAVSLEQPIGVARVLVADLTSSGHVIMHKTATSQNAAIVRRLLDGIRAL